MMLCVYYRCFRGTETGTRFFILRPGFRAKLFLRLLHSSGVTCVQAHIFARVFSLFVVLHE